MTKLLTTHVNCGGGHTGDAHGALLGLIQHGLGSKVLVCVLTMPIASLLWASSVKWAL